MEFMLAWFPFIKWAIFVVCVIIIWWLAMKGHIKTALVGLIILALAIVFAPVKIDGTKSRLNHIKTHTERTQEYNEVWLNKVIQFQEKPSFQERMDNEAKRSNKANERIQDEIQSVHTN